MQTFSYEGAVFNVDDLTSEASWREGFSRFMENHGSMFDPEVSEIVEKDVFFESLLESIVKIRTELSGEDFIARSKGMIDDFIDRQFFDGNEFYFIYDIFNRDSFVIDIDSQLVELGLPSLDADSVADIIEDIVREHADSYCLSRIKEEINNLTFVTEISLVEVFSSDSKARDYGQKGAQTTDIAINNKRFYDAFSSSAGVSVLDIAEMTLDLALDDVDDDFLANPLNEDSIRMMVDSEIDLFSEKISMSSIYHLKASKAAFDQIKEFLSGSNYQDLFWHGRLGMEDFLEAFSKDVLSLEGGTLCLGDHEQDTSMDSLGVSLSHIDPRKISFIMDDSIMQADTGLEAKQKSSKYGKELDFEFVI